MTKDITYCCADECPSTECRIKVTNNHFEPHEILSMADFAGTCRFYIGWVLSEMGEMDEVGEWQTRHSKNTTK